MKDKNYWGIFHQSVRGVLIFVFAYKAILDSSTLHAAPPQSLPQENHQTPGLAIARISLPAVTITEKLIQSDTNTSVTAKIVTILQKLQNVQKQAVSLIQMLRDLYDTTINEAGAYHHIVSDIETRLQVGTTPANPHLKSLQLQAETAFKHIVAAVNNMEDFAQSLQKYNQDLFSLYNETQSTFLLPGAVEQDHANLVFLRDELSHTLALLKNLLRIVIVNKQRQSRWSSKEKDHFMQITQAVIAGRLLTNGNSQAIPFPEPVGIDLLSPQTVVKVEPAPRQPVIITTPLPQPSTRPQTVRIEVEKAEQPPITIVPAITQAPPVAETQASSAPKVLEETIPTLTEIARGRAPLGIITLAKGKTAQDFKWYAYNSATRGLRENPKAMIDIVVTSPQNLSEHTIKEATELKRLLTEMGILDYQLRILQATDASQAEELIYIY